MSSDEFTERTTIVTGDTVGSQLSKAQNAPPSIVVIMGPVASIGKQYFLEKSEYLLGRSSECEIHIEDRSVSRQHAKIRVDVDGVYIEDLNSANKTYVGSTKLQPNLPFKLNNEDQIKVGSVLLKFYEKGNIQSYATQALLEKMRKDALTGAYTKGALLEKAPEAIKQAQQAGQALTMIVFDIDHFKKINDTYGHPGGDFVLKELAQIVFNNVIRQEDFFARFGGEEFVILLFQADLKVGFEVAERLRATVQKHVFKYQDKVIPVTVSLGVGQLGPADTGWDVFFNRVDQALYQSKQSGRNRVTLST